MVRKWVISPTYTWGFPKWWYPTTMGFPTKTDRFGVFWGTTIFGNTHMVYIDPLTNPLQTSWDILYYRESIGNLGKFYLDCKGEITPFIYNVCRCSPCRGATTWILFLFFLLFVLFNTMGFINIVHHHLGEYCF